MFDSLKTVIATPAFGQGVNFPAIDEVIIYGPVDDLISLWQMSGRCARGEGMKGRTMIYRYPHSVCVSTHKQCIIRFLELAEEGKLCLRKIILDYFKITENAEDYVSAVSPHECCCVCKK